MKPETQQTISMLLKADETVTQNVMDAIMTAMNGGVMDDVVKCKEAMRRLGVCRRTCDYLANKGILVRVYGIGRRAIGYTGASVTKCTLGMTRRRAGRLS